MTTEKHLEGKDTEKENYWYELTQKEKAEKKPDTTFPEY